jgi:hypothetical protein
MFPDGFNQNQAAACPVCGVNPWRNCQEMQWFDVHIERVTASKPLVDAW